MENFSKTNKRGDPNKRGKWNTSIHPINRDDAGPAEGGVPGVHVHPLFWGETTRNLP